MDYCTILEQSEFEYIERRSRFIAIAKRVDSVDEGLAFVAGIKKQYKDATHCPYAIVSEPSLAGQKISDDGEPQGSSATPILGAINAKGLKGIAIAVVRYFGGVKLGVGGLAAAYGKAAMGALNAAKEVEAKECSIMTVRLSYEETAALDKKSGDWVITDKEYSQDVVVTAAVADSDGFLEAVKELSCGKADIKTTNKRYHFFYKGELR